MAQYVIKPMLMDAGRAYPPTGAGRTPKVRSVAITHGRGVTADHQAGAELRRRSAATVRLALEDGERAE